MKFNKENLLSKTLTLIFLIIICIFTIDFRFFSIVPLDVLVTFISIGLIIGVNIIKCSNKGPSLNLMFWIFNFLFNFIAPMAQIAYGRFPFRVNIDYNDIFFSNVLLIISYIIFDIIIYIKSQKSKESDYEKENSIFTIFKRELNITNKFMTSLFIISTIICIYYIMTYGLSNLLIRSTAITIYGDNQIEFLIKGTIFPTVMSVAVAFSIMYYKNNKKLLRLFLMIYFLMIFIITFSPFSLPRFKMAALYGSILLLAFKSMRIKNYFLYTFIIGMILIFPTLSSLRNYKISEIKNIFEKTAIGVKQDFYSGDYDSYSTIPLVIEYSREYDITYGKQLTGVMFFFVPRSIWTNKPTGSGAMIAKNLNKEFENVSCQFFAEGYINFGIVGFLLFDIILAIIIKKMDVYFAKYVNNRQNNITMISLMYYYVLFLIFFALRGDLLSSFSYTIGVVLTIGILSFFCVKQTNAS